MTLELGGKSPVIIDKSAKMESVISRVSAIKWLNVGQICVAPDYVLVHKDREQVRLQLQWVLCWIMLFIGIYTRHDPIC